jgi:hypothetical protein
MTKILIATPAYGETFYTPYVSSVIRLQRLMAQQTGFDVRVDRLCRHRESHNFLLTDFYDKADATHMLFIDADMGYDPTRRRHGRFALNQSSASSRRGVRSTSIGWRTCGQG